MKSTPIILTLILLLKSYFFINVLPSCEEGAQIFDNKYTCSSSDNKDIGSGTNGTVFLVKEIASGENRVLKIGRRDVMRQNENVINKVLNLHKNKNDFEKKKYIAQFYERRQDREFNYEIFEYASKGSLLELIQKFLENNKKDDRYMLQLFKKIIQGVQVIHDNGIIHADLKLENIVLDKNDDPKIIDFDISVPKNSFSAMRGTMHYIAPEVLTSLLQNKKDSFNEKMDIWSLGIILYNMISYDHPFSFTIFEDKLYVPNYKIIKFKKGIPYDIIHIILMMLKYNSEDRATLDQVLKAISDVERKNEWQVTEDDVLFFTNINYTEQDIRKIKHIQSEGTPQLINIFKLLPLIVVPTSIVCLIGYYFYKKQTTGTGNLEGIRTD